MPLLGAHMSIAGGYFKALEAAHPLGMEACQLFTKNTNQWKAKEITDEDIRLFRTSLKASNLKYPTAHNSYLINLASPSPVLYERSIAALIVEVRRAEVLGLS